MPSSSRGGISAAVLWLTSPARVMPCQVSHKLAGIAISVGAPTLELEGLVDLHVARLKGAVRRRAELLANLGLVPASNPRSSVDL